MLLFPNDEMPYEVAVTAWTQLMGCEKYEGARDPGRDPRLPRHLLAASAPSRCRSQSG